MQFIYDALRVLKVAEGRIFAETFGPAGLVRHAEGEEVEVAFVKSGSTAKWRSGVVSILALAEDSGLRPKFDCRNGACGTCKTKLVKGSVTYNALPTAQVAEGEVLICCARPNGEGLQLEL